ncbi:cytochrome c-type biogenesis protein [Vibrio tritonius]
MMWRSVVATFVLLWASHVWAAIDVYHFDSAEQEIQFQELSAALRCPKCQNNTIADSNAALAKDLRQKVYEMTKEGKSRQDIVDYMVARYGDFITYNPPLTLGTLILWVGPLLVLMFGLVMIWYCSRRSSLESHESDNWDSSKEERLNTLLARFEKEVNRK